MDSTNFDQFNSPAGGVELSDTLSDWRKKTNGIIEKIDSLETKVKTSDVTNNSIVLGKIEKIENLKVLGNTSGSEANVSEISILDQDTLSSNSATALATQQSIKAYVDSLKFSKTHRLISATAKQSEINVAGFVTSNSNLSAASNPVHSSFGIYDSNSTTAPSSLDWSNILPMTFASNVEKTIIRARWNWDVGGGDSEEMSFGTIIIDWENSKIYGSVITNYEHEISLYLPQTTIADAATDYDFQDYIVHAFDPDMRIGITGSTKTITKLPWFTLSSNKPGYTPDEAQYEIENHIRG